MDLSTKTLKVDELIKHYNIVLSCHGRLLSWVLRELVAHCCLADRIQESHEFAFGIQCGRFLKDINKYATKINQYTLTDKVDH